MKKNAPTMFDTPDAPLPGAPLAERMRPTGFDEVILRGDQSQAAAQKALDLFAPVGFYQGDVAETRPWFLRSPA